MRRAISSRALLYRHWRLLRRRLFRIWLWCAMPWLALISFGSIYDHHKSIRRLADTIEGFLPGIDWLWAIAHYSGEAIAIAGLLPAALTLFLFVGFLPWASRWSRGGTIED